MASVTLALPNQTDGALVEVDGLGIFKNGETSNLDDTDVQVYLAQRADADGYAFRNGNGVTWNGLDDHLYPEEEAEATEESQDEDDDSNVDLDSMTIKQLNEYNEKLDAPHDLTGLKKSQMVQTLKGEEVTDD